MTKKVRAVPEGTALEVDGYPIRPASIDFNRKPRMEIYEISRDHQMAARAIIMASRKLDRHAWNAFSATQFLHGGEDVEGRWLKQLTDKGWLLRNDAGLYQVTRRFVRYWYRRRPAERT